MNREELQKELKETLGISEEVLSGIKDDQLNAMFEKLKPKKLDFNQFLTDPKNQAEFDRRINKALETAKRKQEPSKIEDPKIEVKGDESDLMKLFNEKFTALTEEVISLKKGAVAQSKTEKAKSLLSKSKLPDNLRESWIKRIDLNSETPIEDQVDVLTKEYDSITQSIADGKELGGSPPSGSKVKPGMSKEELKKALV